MSDISITLSIIGVALVLFGWNPVPAAVVTTGATLALFGVAVGATAGAVPGALTDVASMTGS